METPSLYPKYSELTIHEKVTYKGITRDYNKDNTYEDEIPGWGFFVKRIIKADEFIVCMHLIK